MSSRFPYIFYVLMLLTLLFFIWLHYYFGAVAAVLMLNGEHSPLLDFLFKYITHVGEVFCITAVILFFGLKKNRKWLMLTFWTFLSAISINLMFKFIIFKDKPRPRKVLNNDALIHFVDGVTVNIDRSFPSGHTFMAAVAATILAYYFRKSIALQVAFWLLAVLVALSRVYLFQHFFIDVATSMSLSLFWCGIMVYLFRFKLRNERD